QRAPFRASYWQNMSSMAQLFPDPLLGAGRADLDERAQSERRGTLRLPLELPVYIARAGAAHPSRSWTRNLSSNGFYCVLHERLTPGEHIECDFVVPTHASRNCDDMLFIR